MFLVGSLPEYNEISALCMEFPESARPCRSSDADYYVRCVKDRVRTVVTHLQGSIALFCTFGPKLVQID